MIRSIALMAALSLASLAGAAWADDPQAPAPTAEASQTPPLRSLCTDRPTKSTSPCTVDPGHFQLESDIGNVTLDHSGGADTTTALYTNPTLKYGVSQTVDVELNITPYETIVSRDRTTDITTRNQGVGDLFVRVKWALAGAAGGDFGLAFVPFVKAPTASGGVGNGAWEGGLIMPVAFNLPAGWSAVVDPEIDILKDPLGEDHHLGFAGLVSLSHPITKTLTGSVEIWGDENDQPGHAIKQASADVGAAWIPASNQNLQFDGGVNFGLNSETPAAQLYVGVSRRF
jgi:hypothetical protein